MRSSAWLCLVLLCSRSAAAEETSAAIARPALTAGVFELVGLGAQPAHLGVYTALSVDLLVTLSDTWTLIPSLGLEFCPEFGNWGGTLFVIADRVVTQLGSVTLTAQAKVGLLHDAVPGTDGFRHDAYLSFGGGMALVTAHGTWLPGLTANAGLTGGGWSLSPTLLFSVPF